MDDRNHLFQRLCHEAVTVCGSDMRAVERYVLERIEALHPPEREHMRRDIARVLAFRAPTRSPQPN